MLYLVLYNTFSVLFPGLNLHKVENKVSCLRENHSVSWLEPVTTRPQVEHCRATKCSPKQYAPTLHTQYASLEHFVYPAYTLCYQRSILCRVGTYVISVVVRGYTICSSWKHVSWYVCLFSNCPFDIHLSLLRTFCLKPCPHHSCIRVVFNPHQQYFGDVVSKFGFLPDIKSNFGNHSKEKWGNSGG